MPQKKALADGRTSDVKVRPQHYATTNPRNFSINGYHAAYLQKYLWRPDCGEEGLPTTAEAKQARIDKLFAAMTDFSNVVDSDNIFTDGFLISNDDIEYTAHCIADSIDNLHKNGLAVPYIADPTAVQFYSRIHGRQWRIEYEERNLTATEREDAIAEHLRLYKKACLDAIANDKDLTFLFVAAPYTARRKRDASFRSNVKRKVRTGAEDRRPTRAKKLRQSDLRPAASSLDIMEADLSLNAQVANPDALIPSPYLQDNPFSVNDANAGQQDFSMLEPSSNVLGDYDWVNDPDGRFNAEMWDFQI